MTVASMRIYFYDKINQNKKKVFYTVKQFIDLLKAIQVSLKACLIYIEEIFDILISHSNFYHSPIPLQSR